MERLKSVLDTRVYRDATRLLELLVDAVVGFPRDHKHTLGARMVDLATDQLVSLSAAYHARDNASRADALKDMAHTHEVLRTLLRIASDRRWLRGRSMGAEVIEAMDRIGRQSAAWRRSALGPAAQPEREGHGPTGEPAAGP